MSDGVGKQEHQRLEGNRAELVERVDRAMHSDGRLEMIPGFFLARSSRPMESVESVYEPSFCIVVQGSKKVLLGDEIFSRSGTLFDLHGGLARRFPG